MHLGTSLAHRRGLLQYRGAQLTPEYTHTRVRLRLSVCVHIIHSNVRVTQSTVTVAKTHDVCKIRDVWFGSAQRVAHSSRRTLHFSAAW